MKARFFVIAALIVSPAPSFAGEKVLVAPAVFSYQSSETAQLRKDCAVAEMVGKEVFNNVKKKMPDVERLAEGGDAGEALVLKVWITELQPAISYGVDPTAWINKMAIRAELHRNARLLTFTQFRAGSPRTGDADCPPLERIAGTLGKRVATWLPGAVVTISHGDSAPAEPSEPGTEQPGK
jgi:hypothetical protein